MLICNVHSEARLSPFSFSFFSRVHEIKVNTSDVKKLENSLARHIRNNREVNLIVKARYSGR